MRTGHPLDFATIIFVCFILCIEAMATSTAAQDAAPLPEGTLFGQTYENKTLGLRFSAPPGWAVSKTDPLPEDTTYFLFCISRSNAETIVPGDPSISWHAFPMPRDRPVTAAQVLRDIKADSEMTGLPLVIDRDTYEETFGGVAFAAMNTHITFSDVRGPQTIHVQAIATVRNGYVLRGKIGYRTDEEMKSLKSVLKSLELSDPSSTTKVNDNERQ